MSGINISGKNIHTLRNLRRLSQQQLGEMIGRDRRYIQRVENGSTFDACYLEPIAKALKIDNPFLLTRSVIDVNNLSNIALVKRR